MNSKGLRFIVICIVIFLSTCASRSVKDQKEEREKREKAIMENYTEEKVDKYAALLVDPERYTTNGAVYQKKYRNYLVAIADDIIEKKNLTIEPGSMGFYFDKKSNDRSRLYVGLDLNMGPIENRDYKKVALGLLDTNLKLIMETVSSCASMFAEEQIVGMVIGFKWKSGQFDEQVNIWMLEEEVIQYENGRITFEELVQRSTLTSSTGKIIILSR